MKRPLLAFTGVAYAWTWVTVLPLLLQKRGVVDLGLPDAYEAVGAFGPFIAAWLVTRRTGGSAAFRAGLTRFALPPAGWGLALLTPVAFLLLAMLVVALQTGSPPSLAALRDGRLGSPGAIIDLIIVGSLLQAVGEEPGWRGCLLPGLLARFGRIEEIPDDPARFDVAVRGAAALASSLAARRDDAALYKQLATLRTDVPLAESLDDLEWKGAHRDELAALCRELDDDEFVSRVPRFRS